MGWETDLLRQLSRLGTGEFPSSDPCKKHLDDIVTHQQHISGMIISIKGLTEV